ncbi:hypothetical protein AB0L53_32350 [Nonomuraea sp. NPDC052129]|uniref:hypothetical protein n=1 Tax=Nonomuraea sp. NPDC052129 TaxID=3154651 RepID=UPI003428F011
MERGYLSDGMVDSSAAAAALTQDLVVFEAGDGVLGDGAFAEPFVSRICDDLPVGSEARGMDPVAALVTAVPGQLGMRG